MRSASNIPPILCARFNGFFHFLHHNLVAFTRDENNNTSQCVCGCMFAARATIPTMCSLCVCVFLLLDGIKIDLSIDVHSLILHWIFVCCYLALPFSLSNFFVHLILPATTQTMQWQHILNDSKTAIDDRLCACHAWILPPFCHSLSLPAIAVSHLLFASFNCHNQLSLSLTLSLLMWCFICCMCCIYFE